MHAPSRGTRDDARDEPTGEVAEAVSEDRDDAVPEDVGDEERCAALELLSFSAAFERRMRARQCPPPLLMDFPC